MKAGTKTGSKAGMKLAIGFSALGSFLLTSLIPITVQAKTNLVEITQKSADQQIHRLLDPLLDKYCHDECKLMNVNVAVDIAKSDEIAPGFDDINSGRADLAPSSAVVKILLNDKIGPVYGPSSWSWCNSI